MTSRAAWSVAVLVHRSGIYAERVPNLDVIELAQAERDQQARDARDQCQQIVHSADAAHALKELPPIKNSNSV